MRRMGIPERFWSAHVRDFGTHLPAAVATWRGQLPGWILSGAVGVGKTHLAAALARSAAAAGREASFVPVAQLLQETRRGYSRDIAVGLAAEAWLLRLNSPVVILDDLGIERITEDRLDVLQRQFEAWYDRDTALVITTNLGPAELRARYGDRVLSRLFQTTQLLPISGRDRRIPVAI